jgi:hypothetical protein
MVSLLFQPTPSEAIVLQVASPDKCTKVLETQGFYEYPDRNAAHRIVPAEHMANAFRSTQSGFQNSLTVI